MRIGRFRGQESRAVVADRAVVAVPVTHVPERDRGRDRKVGRILRLPHRNHPTTVNDHPHKLPPAVQRPPQAGSRYQSETRQTHQAHPEVGRGGITTNTMIGVIPSLKIRGSSTRASRKKACFRLEYCIPLRPIPHAWIYKNLRICGAGAQRIQAKPA